MLYYQCKPLKIVDQINKTTFEMVFGIFEMKLQLFKAQKFPLCFTVTFLNINMILQR